MDLLADGTVAKFAIPALHKGAGAATRRCVKVAEALWKVNDRLKVLLPTLVEAMKHTDPDVHGAAANVIGDMGKAAKAAVPTLASALKDPKRNPLPAVLALKELGPAAAKTTVPACFAIVREKDEICRDRRFPVALGGMGPSAVPELTEALQDKQKQDDEPRHRHGHHRPRGGGGGAWPVAFPGRSGG